MNCLFSLLLRIVHGRATSRAGPGQLLYRCEVLAGIDEAVRFEVVLFLVKLAVAAVQGKQRVVRAALHDLAVLEDENLLGASDRGETVGDDEGGPAAAQGFQPVLDECFTFAVQAGRRFVENEDGRVGENGAGDGDALPLARRIV